MSTAAAQAARFFAEIIETQAVWTVRDDGGVPAPMSSSGERAMPFWSKESRAQRVIDTAPAFDGFQTQRVELADFIRRWLPGLERDGLAVGVNWSGQYATGYDLSPEQVMRRIQHALGGQSSDRN